MKERKISRFTELREDGAAGPARIAHCMRIHVHVGEGNASRSVKTVYDHISKFFGFLQE